MAKVNKKRRWIFPIALLLYALVFLGIAAYGLDRLWDYMDAYEQSRPHIALDNYMEQLSAEYIADASGELISQIDHNVQTAEECRQVILNSLNDRFSLAKKSAESDEDHHVYVIRCGSRIIGTMEMKRQGESLRGFIPWEVTGDRFDLSYLLTEPASITVPSSYCVFVLGKQLSSSYITEDNIPYPLLAELYGDYSLPHMITYTAGPFLGNAELAVTDPKGNPVILDKDTDMNAFLNNCTGEETAALDIIIEDFIQSYVDFTSCTGNDTKGNYTRLSQHMVSGGELAKRMYSAMDGLYWVSDRGAKLSSVTTHHYINIGGGRYLCDITYGVDTRDFSGSVQTTASVKLIFVQTPKGLKAEAMLSS